MKLTALAFLVLFLVLCPLAQAQTGPTPRSIVGQPQELRTILDSLTATGTSPWFDVTGYGVTNHALTYYVTGAPASVSLALECSNNGGSSATSTVATGTSTTGGTISGNALCTHWRANLTLSGGTAPRVSIVYSGSGTNWETGQTVLQSSATGTLTALNSLAVVSSRTVSAANTQNQVVLDTGNLVGAVAIISTCSAGTAALTIESSVDNTNWLTIDSVTAAATNVKSYLNSTVGASTAVSPTAFRYLRVTTATCGASNTSTLTVSIKGA